MELYNKESLKQLVKNIDNNGYFLPNALFNGHKFAVRLETKLAYAAILDTLMHKPSYNKEGKAFIKTDNPEIKNTLAQLANKDVDQEKVNKYIQELYDANLVEVERQDMYVYDLER